MRIHTSIAALRATRVQVGRVALVPTMGNLHDGHIALMHAAREFVNADFPSSPPTPLPQGERGVKRGTVIASIFVNRLQFGQGEDFDKYPRTFEADCERLAAAGIDHLFAPDEAEMYPKPQRYHVTPDPEHASILEGAFRPGHFGGVVTVVLKLFNIVQPNVALFGKKDYQQVMVLKNMVHELGLPIEIIALDTVRNADGLAQSSRNSYLSAEERAEAPRLYQQLSAVAEAVRNGAHDFVSLEATALAELEQHGWKPDYLTVRRRTDLKIPEQPDEPLVVLAAACLGTTRLIDNIEI
ncbi:MAG: pantoate--beta-alanine ligase [Burkholderiales bacterium]|jgi:pantoate--beta-alanine ligase|nr:pantoate--beta-alanine ligase [Burkholderiales bacterium]